jgi:predicted ribosome quality control (RQC) complex YloA/Tae2 family protein
MHEASLLRVGRHLRLPLGSKLVVGRNEGENKDLEGRVRTGDLVLTTEDCPGPTAILAGQAAEGELELAASIVARYSDGKRGERVTVRATSQGLDRVIVAVPLDAESTRKLLI